MHKMLSHLGRRQQARRLLLTGAGVLLALTSNPARVRAAGEPPTPSAPDLSQIRKQIVVRAADGSPVPGIVVQLSPATPDLGGPAAGGPGRQATTDAQGSVIFAGLGPWIWYATLAGAYQAHELQPAVDQGRPPYGFNPAGGGFPVRVEAAEDPESVATPVMIAGVPQPEVQTTGFVLLPVDQGARLAPTYDQVLPPAAPQPLFPIDATTPPTAPPSPVISPLAVPSETGESVADNGTGELVAAVIGLAIVAYCASLRFQQRRVVRQRARLDVTAKDQQ